MVFSSIVGSDYYGLSKQLSCPPYARHISQRTIGCIGMTWRVRRTFVAPGLCRLTMRDREARQRE